MKTALATLLGTLSVIGCAAEKPDEASPENASAVGQIVRVDSVKVVR